ncbi:MAG: hypothetical protein KJS97_07355 [Alphaproteobacteria bacterium]|nr:hypothetical protein [Alphaproteobacteria bacterium]
MTRRGATAGGLAALAVAAAALAGAAIAKPAAPDPVPGAWAFQTAPYGPDCLLVGQMQITAGKTPGTYTCRFETRETCRPWKARATQSCTATRAAGGGLVITSAVISSEGSSYKPDDFTLDTLGRDEMRGVMSSVYRAPVVFSRKAALTS